MATIFKRDNSPFWQAAFFDADGTRRYRSTGIDILGTGKKTEAGEIAAEWEAQAVRARRAARDGQAELLDVLQRAAALQGKGRLTHDKAVELLQEIHEFGEPDEALSRTVRAWCDEWLEAKGTQVKAGTLDGYKADLSAVLDALGKPAGGPLEKLTTRHVQAAQKALKGGGNTARTVNKKIHILSQAIGRAAELGHIPRNVAGAVKPLPQEDSVSVEAFTTKEVSAILKKAPDDEWRGAILLLAHTGLRRNNVTKLVWRDVDLKAKTLTVLPVKQQRKKKAKAVVVPLSAECVKYLKSLPTPIRPTTPVFPELSKRAGPTISARFETLRKQAGVPKEIGTPGGGTAKRSLHSLRHWFVTTLANKDIPAEVRMAISAHKDSESHAFYTHVDAAKARDAIDHLPRLEAG